jgi:hypothetical protein
MAGAKRGPLKAELLELLEELLHTNTDAGGRCHYCLADAGTYHDDGCLWLRVADVLEQGDLASACHVGQALEDAAPEDGGDGGEDDFADEPGADAPPRRGRTPDQRRLQEVAQAFERDVAALDLKPGTLLDLRDTAQELAALEAELQGEEPLVPTLIDITDLN